MPGTSPILIAACGNELAGGDAFGPLVGKELRGRLPAGAELIELVMNPAALLDHLEGRRGLILIDAAWVPNMHPGTLLACEWDSEARPALATDRATSTHGLSVANQIELARRLGILPPVVWLCAVAINPCADLADTENGVREKVPEAAARVCALSCKLLEI